MILQPHQPEITICDMDEAEKHRQRRNQKLTELEAERRKLEREWLQLTREPSSLTRRERDKRSRLRRDMDRLNSEIVAVIIAE